MRKVTNTMENSPKEIVKQAYDFIAEWYLTWIKGQRSPREQYAQNLLEDISTITKIPRVLDLGCGPGVPVTRLLLDSGAQVIANDISPKQIALAKSHCAGASFILGDMLSLSFDKGRFDGVVAFFTIFHLPRAEQHTMLRKIYTWLAPGGALVLNLATVDEEEIYGEFRGHGMYWSSYGVEENKAMICDAGFEVVDAEILEAGDGQLEEGDADYGVKFLWIRATRPFGH